MTSQGNLHLVITERSIIVTVTGTNFLVAYRKVDGKTWLAVSHLQDDPNANMKQAEFLTQAWSAANDEARALGWIV